MNPLCLGISQGKVLFPKRAALGFWVWLSRILYRWTQKMSTSFTIQSHGVSASGNNNERGKSIDSGQPTTGNRGEGHKNQSTHRQREIAYKFVSNCFFYLQRGSIPQPSPLYKPAAVLSLCYPRGIV